MGGIYPQQPQMMPGAPFIPFPQQSQAQPPMSGQQINPQEYLIAQQIAMQNMMQQMYMQYLNHYANQAG